MAREPAGGWTRIAAWAALAAAAANALLLSATYIRGRAETSLQSQVTTLRDNLATLTELRTERQVQLEGGLAAAEARVQAAEAAMPPVETAFDVFDLAYAVAGDDGEIVVLSVRRESSELKQTSIGLVEITTHRVTAAAGLDACLHYLGLLESQGAGLGLAGVMIQPDQTECSAEVLTLGRP